MPWNQVMHKWGEGKLHSGGKGGPVVKSQDQAIAIMMSEKRKAQHGNKEYAAKGARRRGQAKALA